MPYIITTRTTRFRNAQRPPFSESSRAVVTLEETRTIAVDIIEQHWETSNKRLYDSVVSEQYSAYQIACYSLPKSGGTIGPLPDGTVIAVRSTDWLELAGLAGWTLDYATRNRLTGRTRKEDRIALIDAYNSKQTALTKEQNIRAQLIMNMREQNLEED